jgi:hypothetical protein
MSDKITPEEQARRRYAVEQANAHNRIEGIMPNPAADAIYERWIAGAIDSDEVTRLIHAIPIADKIAALDFEASSFTGWPIEAGWMREGDAEPDPCSSAPIRPGAWTNGARPQP